MLGKKRPFCENFGFLLRNRTGDLLLEGRMAFYHLNGKSNTFFSVRGSSFMYVARKACTLDVLKTHKLEVSKLFRAEMIEN